MSDLNILPEFPIKTTPAFQTLISQFENGVEQRRAKRANPIYSWDLVFKNRQAADLSTLWTLFIAKLGPLTAFTWTDPDPNSPTYNTQFNVRFKDDSTFIYQVNAYNLYDITFTIVQVL